MRICQLSPKAKSIVDVLNNNIVSFANYATMVDGCMNLINQILRWKLKHCNREANACADKLARMTIHLQQSFVILDTLHVEMPLFLLYDLTGLRCNRLCTKSGPCAL